MAAGEWDWVSRDGRLRGEAVRACGADAVATVYPGKSGQVAGGVTMGLPEAALAVVAAPLMEMAQWWVP